MVVKRPRCVGAMFKYQDWLKMSGTMLVYLHIPNFRFSYKFDIRRNYGLLMENIKEVYLLGFPEHFRILTNSQSC